MKEIFWASYFALKPKKIFRPPVTKPSIWFILSFHHVLGMLWGNWSWSSLAQVMACHLIGTKLLPQLMVTYCQIDPKGIFREIWVKIQQFSFCALRNVICQTTAILFKPPMYHSQNKMKGGEGIVQDKIQCYVFIYMHLIVCYQIFWHLSLLLWRIEK